MVSLFVKYLIIAYLCHMIINKVTVMKPILTLVLCVCCGMVFASFVSNSTLFDNGKDREKKIKLEKYSLKNYHRPISFYSLSSLNYTKEGLHNIHSGRIPFMNNLVNAFSEQSDNSSESNDIYVHSTIRVKKGNTIVLFPYNYIIKSAPLSMFKTPMAPNR